MSNRKAPTPPPADARQPAPPPAPPRPKILHGHDPERVLTMAEQQVVLLRQTVQQHVEALERVQRRLVNHAADNPRASLGLVHECLDIIRDALVPQRPSSSYERTPSPYDPSAGARASRQRRP